MKARASKTVPFQHRRASKQDKMGILGAQQFHHPPPSFTMHVPFKPFDTLNCGLGLVLFLSKVSKSFLGFLKSQIRCSRPRMRLLKRNRLFMRLDVLSEVRLYMHSIKSYTIFSEVTVFWLLVAALGHDLGHLGVRRPTWSWFLPGSSWILPAMSTIRGEQPVLGGAALLCPLSGFEWHMGSSSHGVVCKSSCCAFYPA